MLGRRALDPIRTHERHVGLMKELASRIRFRGPLTVAEYIALANTHPTFGYYMNRDVFGREGDFTTSPEVSQVFGELVGVWCVACWDAMGRPPRIRLVEAGPGRGTLMSDVLRATRSFPAFFTALVGVHLIEVSPFNRESQRKALTPHAPPATLHWHRELGELAGLRPGDKEAASAAGQGADMPGSRDEGPSVDVTDRSGERAGEAAAGGGGTNPGFVFGDPDAPVLLIAHEFLDALPIHQLVRTPAGWREKLIDLRVHKAPPKPAPGASPEPTPKPADLPGVAENSSAPLPAQTGGAAGSGPGVGDAAAGLAVRNLDYDARDLEFVLAPSPTAAVGLFGKHLPAHLDAAEVCPSALDFTRQACDLIRKAGGAALLIDYGIDGPPADSLRGEKKECPDFNRHTRSSPSVGLPT
jgi:NADH dehydrogenase [ubiquinone] 1 alpha subcomplex assembly factor 7